MNPRILLDTHIVVRWLYEPQRLSRDQYRAMDDAEKRGEGFAISGMTLVEIAVLNVRRERLRFTGDDLFRELEANPSFKVLPVTIDIGREVVALGDALRDPADRVIVATARVHGMRLLTADERIIDSRLVSVIE